MLFILSRGATDCAVISSECTYGAFCVALNGIATRPDDDETWKSEDGLTYVWRGTDGTMWFLNVSFEAGFYGKDWDLAIHQHDMLN